MISISNCCTLFLTTFIVPPVSCVQGVSVEVDCWNKEEVAEVYWQEAGLGRDKNGVGVELLNDEMQCVHFGCGVELNRFFTI